MGKAGKNPYADSEFLRAYKIEVRELETEYAVRVVSSIEVSKTGSRIDLVHDAYEDWGDHRGDAPICSYRTTWPNGSTRSFTAELYHAATQLERLVRDSKWDLFMACDTKQGGRC